MKNLTNHSPNKKQLKTTQWLLPGVIVLASFSTLSLAGCGYDDGHDDGHDADANHVSDHSSDHMSAHSAEPNSDSNSDAEHHSNMQMQDVILATVVSVDQDNRQLVLDHEALPTIGMDAMTMGFAVSDSVNLNTLQVGDRIQVTVSMQPGTGLQITQISKVQ